MPQRLGARGEPRTVDDHQRAGVNHVLACRAGGLGSGLATPRAVGVGERDVHHTADAVVDRVLATPRPVDDLVGHDDGARSVFWFQGTDGAGGEHLSNTDRAQGPEVGAVVDSVWGEAMALPVPGEEGHTPTFDLADQQVVAGLTERGADGDALGVSEERVEPRAADDADLRASRGGGGGVCADCHRPRLTADRPWHAASPTPVDGVVDVRTDVEKVARRRQSQAAEPWDVEAVLEEVWELSDFDAVFVVPAFDESEDAGEEPEDEPPAEPLRVSLRESVR